MATTIDAENAKQIRRKMDVLIKVEPESGDPIIINNENLIKAVVSLRSDLSIANPTLPESELNVEAYFDDDISEALAEIPDDTPITYQAGYDSDLSPERKFYLAEKITWEDNVMSIHAVDAVHLLDKELPAALNVRSTPNTAVIYPGDLTAIYHTICYILGSVGIDFSGYVAGEFDRPGVDLGVENKFVIKKGRRRDILAALMNLLHIDFASGAFDVIDSFWPIYVDAGIPTLSIEKPSSAYDIYEDDCGEVKKNIERQITGIDLAWEHITAEAYNYRIIGSGTFQKNTGVFVKLDSEYTCSYAVTGNLDEVQGSHSRIPPVYEDVATSVQAYSGVAEYGDNSIPSYSVLMLGPDIPKGIMIGPPNYSSIAGHELYSQVMPWTSDTARAWNALSPASDVETIDVDLYGRAFEPKTLKHSYGSSGNRLEINDDKFLGVLYTIGRNGSVVYNAQVLPKLGHESLLQRSNITGSFIWKGDPRMQPRDVFTFHRLDGTAEDCTLENITITHEKGGTSAEITYRKGIC